MTRLNPLRATEEMHHLALMDWVQTQPQISQIFIHHALERKCHPWEGNKFKKLGVKPGFPDFSLLLPTKAYHGLFIELKRDYRSALSLPQKWWIDYLNSVGYLAKIAYGATEAIQIIKDYLNNVQVESQPKEQQSK